MQESVSMHKSPTPVRHSRMNQAREEEEEKETGKTEARRLMERKAASPPKKKDNQNKAYLGTDRLTKQAKHYNLLQLFVL